jgi:hypothetical protein
MYPIVMQLFCIPLAMKYSQSWLRLQRVLQIHDLDGSAKFAVFYENENGINT